MIATPTPQNIAQAATIIAAGGLIGLPTETVYGLAADASNPNAVAKIYATKDRPNNHPVIVHLAPDSDIHFWAKASSVPAYTFDLIKAFWPGALTVVLPRTANAGNFITGNQTTVALRCPSHPVAQQILQACAALGIHGLAAPSANRFGRVSPTTAQHVFDEFNNHDTDLNTIFTLDGGACEVGIESTIVDCTQGTPRILRYGAITRDDIARVTGLSVIDNMTHTNNTSHIHTVIEESNQPQYTAPRVSGDLAAHYAPNTPLKLCQLNELAELEQLANVSFSKKEIVFMGFEAPHNLSSLVKYQAMPHDAKQYAQQLYATLRQLDSMNYALIAVQPVPTDAAWAGITDRLTRAVATFGNNEIMLLQRFNLTNSTQ